MINQLHKTLLLIVFSQICFLGLQAQESIDQLLANNIENGLLNYENLLNHKDQIETYLYSSKLHLEKNQSEVSSLINHYNFLVIYKVLENYPIQSVEQVKGFFTNTHSLAPYELSLDKIEKKLIETTRDPRIHFALNCAAIGCPSLSPNLFNKENLDQQLDFLSASALEQNQHFIINRSNKLIKLNQIFKWYRADFESIGVLEFINQYIEEPIDESFDIEYIQYDWSLNSNAGFRYYATNLYEKGEFEIQFFNNYYTQRETGELSENNFGRYNFFNSFLNATIGLNSTFNISLSLKFRSVSQNLTNNEGLWDALNFRNDGFIYNQNAELEGYTRFGLAALYPGIKYNPFKDHPNISFYHAVHIPLGYELEGNDDFGFLDWENITIHSNMYYTKDISHDQVLFLDVGLLFENVGTFWFNGDTGFSQIGAPVTLIYSFFPNYTFSYYGLINLAPRVAINFGDSNEVKLAPFGQIGGGVKYFLSEKLEAELLYTFFYDGVQNRRAHTFNLGFRYYGI